jgi:hypothetical protein
VSGGQPGPRMLDRGRAAAARRIGLYAGGSALGEQPIRHELGQPCAKITCTSVSIKLGHLDHPPAPTVQNRILGQRHQL